MDRFFTVILPDGRRCNVRITDKSFRLFCGKKEEHPFIMDDRSWKELEQYVKMGLIPGEVFTAWKATINHNKALGLKKISKKTFRSYLKYYTRLKNSTRDFSLL